MGCLEANENSSLYFELKGDGACCVHVKLWIEKLLSETQETLDDPPFTLLSIQHCYGKGEHIIQAISLAFLSSHC